MKIKFNRKMIMTGIIAFLVIAASICFYYLIFRSEAFSAKINTFISILSPVIYGIIIAYLLTPIVNFIERRMLKPLFTKKNPEMTIKKKKCMRVISVILSLLLISLLLYAFISVIVPEVSRSIIAISYQFPYYIRNLTQFSNKLLQDNPTLNDLFIQVVDDYSGEFSNFLNKTIIPQTQEILKHISLSLLSFLKTLWNVVIGAIISVYVLFNKELFAGQAKKIAYAASFGGSEVLPNDKENIKKWLKRYDKITIRENSGVKIANELGVPAEQVLDPTFLLEKSEWEKLIPQRECIEKYVLVYQLHPNKQFDEYAKQYAKKKGLKLYRLSHCFHHIVRSGKFVCCPPIGEFLWYIKNAEHFLTDSFHGTAFAIGLNTQFTDVLPKSYSERISSILQLIGYENRILKSYNDFDIDSEKIDFEKVNEKISAERKKSLDILKNMIGD